ncbi:LysR family transcriptional regulator [Nostoc sp. 3335mG]|nr:LysR family transcriptional regulator [Nostoc sp. 3335mG]
MPRRLYLRQIEAFKAVIENGTVSRAASVLNISQPAMSRLIAYLEADTELKLFDRVKGRLTPTEHGLRLYDEVGRIFAGVRQVETAVEAIRREEQGRLAVGAIIALSGAYLKRSTTQFLESRPNLFFSIYAGSSKTIVDGLIARRLDVGLVSSTFDNPYVIVEPLMEHPLVCIMPSDHPLTSKAHVEPQDLDQIPFVSFDSDTYIGRRVEALIEKYHIKPSFGITANLAPVVCEYVASGFGVSLIHPLMVTGFEDRLAVRRFEPEVASVFLLGRSAESRNAKLVEGFIETLRVTANEISAAMLRPTV